MSVNLIPMLIDGQILSGEITRLAKTLSTAKLDNPETQFHDALFFEHGSSRNQYAYAKFECKNTRYSHDADSIRLQLLINAREKVIDDGETGRSADALFQFFGTFFCCFTRTNPFNEFGFRNSTIISTASSRRLHLLFQQINFDLLRSVFEQHYRRQDDGGEYSYIGSFIGLVDYARALDGLLIQAIENDKWLYIYAG